MGFAIFVKKTTPPSNKSVKKKKHSSVDFFIEEYTINIKDYVFSIFSFIFAWDSVEYRNTICKDDSKKALLYG